MIEDKLLLLPSRERVKWNHGEESSRRKKEGILRRNVEHKRMNVMTESYWPFGRPGGGAPNYTARRTKHPCFLPAIVKPGDGPLPRLPSVRRRVKFSDPQLRFADHPAVRRSIDIHWRYWLIPQQVKDNYRRDLERQIQEYHLLQVGGWSRPPQRRHHPTETQLGMSTDFGKPGPGGSQWRHPAKVGMNFLHSLGWTGEKAFRRLEDQLDVRKPSEQPMLADKPHTYYTTPEEALTGGIEIVPLLARRRSFKKTSHLPSCDVTNPAAAPTERKPAWSDASPPTIYHRVLDNQVCDKKGQAKLDKEEDQRSASRHFETWDSLWGRPGHGAPRAGGERAKGDLGKLLYREPGLLWPAQRLKVR